MIEWLKIDWTSESKYTYLTTHITEWYRASRALQNEKRKMLIEQETEKIKMHEQGYKQELANWKANLQPRKQVGARYVL